MRRANIITNHVPLTDFGKYPTLRLINKNLINTIQNNALFIHASRGKIIDEPALLKRLKDGQITAVIDVWEDEPLINPELAKLTMIAMPHVAGYSRDGKLKGALMMVRQFEKYLGIKIDAELIEDELNSSKSDMDNTNFQDSVNLLEKLKYNRDFEYDHNKLLLSLDKSDNERAKEFDMMRKQYPIRRETLIPK
jgi:erythronate-4-phosphate dehydrogenase